MLTEDRPGALPKWPCAGTGCTTTEYSLGRPKGWVWTTDEHGNRSLLCPPCRLRAVIERKAAAKKGKKPRRKRRPEPKLAPVPKLERPTEPKPKKPPKPKTPARLVSRICAVCKIGFVTTRRSQRYCGADCRLKAHRAKHTPPRPDTRPCEECGKDFAPKQARSRHCGAECRQRAHKRKQRKA